MTDTDHRAARPGRRPIPANPHWSDHGACNGHPDPEIFFPSSGEATKIREAVAICVDCPVWAECRQDGIDGGDSRSGIWGGLTEADRRRLRQPGTNHGGPRTRAADETRAAAVARFHELRPSYPTDTRCGTVVGAEFEVSATAVIDWVRAARRAQQAGHDTDTEG